MAGIQFDLSNFNMDVLAKDTPRLLEVLDPHEFQLLMVLCKIKSNGEATLMEASKYLTGATKADALKIVKSMTEKGVFKDTKSGADLSQSGFQPTTTLAYAKIKDSKGDHIKSGSGDKKPIEKQPVKRVKEPQKMPMDPPKPHKKQPVTTQKSGAVSINIKTKSSEDIIPSPAKAGEGQRIPTRSKVLHDPLEVVPEKPKTAGKPKKLDLKTPWLVRLKSTDKGIRTSAEKQVGSMYANIYKKAREMLLGGKKFFVGEKSYKQFAQLYVICNEYDIKFVEYITWTYNNLQDWDKSPVEFPPVDWLLREGNIQKFQLRKRGKGDGSSKVGDAFRTGLKNPALPDILKKGGFDLDGDQIKFVESIARQRKIGIEADCEPDLEAAVKHAMAHGCPDM